MKKLLNFIFIFVTLLYADLPSTTDKNVFTDSFDFYTEVCKTEKVLKNSHEVCIPLHIIGKYKISFLAYEPVVQCSAKYYIQDIMHNSYISIDNKRYEKVNIPSVSDIRIMADLMGNSYWIMMDTGATIKEGTWTFNAPLSPEWNQFILYDFYGARTSKLFNIHNNLKYLNKKKAIDIFRTYSKNHTKNIFQDFDATANFYSGNLIRYIQEKKNKSTKPQKSLMLLIDASGSMKGSKFSAAKSAAISNAKKAISKNVEVSVAFFGGECSDTNVLHLHDFTQDVNSLTSFIQNATIMGGTPLSLALKQANEYMYAHKSKSSKSETILLLGDGEGNCGNIQSVIDDLKSNNTFAHHETIGLEVDAYSKASSQLANIASQSGGNYHTSNSVSDLERVFEDASDIEELNNMIGSFGSVNNNSIDRSSNNGMQSILDGFE